MRKLSRVEIKNWNLVLNNKSLGFSLKEKNLILKKLHNINNENSMETKCLYFRQCLELLIWFLLKDKVPVEELNKLHLIDKINLVEKNIVEFNSIKREFHIIRFITNKYIHGNGNRPKEDKNTLYFVMNKIQKWFMSYGKSLEYQINYKSNVFGYRKKEIDRFYLYILGVIVFVLFGYLVLKFIL